MVDEPREFPDGTVLDVLEADPYAHLDDSGELDDKDRDRLSRVLEHSLAQAKAGEGRPMLVPVLRSTGVARGEGRRVD